MNNRKHDRAEFYRRICEYKVAHDGRNPTHREMAAWFATSNAVVDHMLGNLRDDGKIAFDERGWYVVGGTYTPPGDLCEPSTESA